jgi:hypothetical protein
LVIHTGKEKNSNLNDATKDTNDNLLQIRDEYQLFYKNGSQKAKDAISVAYIGPSITPFPDLNPGFR